jgi:hypothetical protein
VVAADRPIGEAATKRQHQGGEMLPSWLVRLATFLVALSLLGCVTSHYTKSVTVTRDAGGKILSIVEYEEVVTPNQNGNGITFSYLPRVQSGNETAKRPY